MDLSKLVQIQTAIYSSLHDETLEMKINASLQFPDNLSIREAGYNGLHICAMKEFTELMIKLIDQGVDFIKQGSTNGYTPLHLFAINSYAFNSEKPAQEYIGSLGQHQIVNILLSEQIKRNKTCNPTCSVGISHLHIACMFDYVEAVEFLLKNGESVNQVIARKSIRFPGCAPLHLAVNFSAVATAKILFDYKADIHLKDVLGRSPLHRLVKRQLDAMDYITMGKRENKTSIVREVNKLETIICDLLNSRESSEVNFVDDIGLSAFHVACTISDRRKAKAFLKDNVNINKPLNDNMQCWAGWTPLHFAACCSIETVKLLVKHGADLTIKNMIGETPLDFCLSRYSPAIVHSILSSKQEFKEILLSDQSMTLLDLILTMDNCDEFNSFLQNLSDINAFVSHDSPIWPGYSIFHLAISMHDRALDIKQYLKQLYEIDVDPEDYTCTEIEEKSYWKRIVICMARQCTVTTRDVDGLTPIHLAFKLRKGNVVDKLLNCCRTNETDFDGVSFLHIACTIGKKNIVERFHTDIEVPTKSQIKWHVKTQCETARPNSTALHIAVIFNHPEIVAFLLGKAANIHAQDSLGFTPVHLSIFSPTIICLIFNTIKVIEEVVSKHGMTHLHVAAFVNFDVVIGVLLKSGANVNVTCKCNVPLSKFSFMNQTPLHVAVKMKHLDAVRTLLSAGASIYASSSSLGYDTPLQAALKDGREVIIEEFVKELRYDRRMRGPIEVCGVTLLHLACAVHDFKWVKKLLSKGADPNARISVNENYISNWKGYTPLHLLFIRYNFVGSKLKTLMIILKLLLEHGVDVTLQCEKGYSPLLLADEIIFEKNKEARRDMWAFIMEDSREIVKNKNTEKTEMIAQRRIETIEMYEILDFMLENQKSYAVNPVSKHGATHFQYACKRNNINIVYKFLKNGVDINQAVNIFGVNLSPGFTPLHYAFAHRSFEVAELLLEHNADVTLTDFQSHNVLHVTAACNVDDVRLLEKVVSMGCNVKGLNYRNVSPFEMLVKSRFMSYDEFKFYIDHGCDLEFCQVDDQQGLIGQLLRSARADHREAIVRLLVESFNFRKKIKNGFNPIQSFVSTYPEPYEWTVDRYLGGIQFFMDLGCKLDAPNIDGKTALHSAIAFLNVGAVEALLLLGANINCIDNTGSRTIYHCSNSWGSTEREDNIRKISLVLSAHIWKMNLVGLQLNERNANLAAGFWWSALIDTGIEVRSKNELMKLAQIRINEKWTMQDLLSDSKIVIDYQFMPSSQRQLIDKMFTSQIDLRREYPEFCGLLTLQYKRAVNNVYLYWSIKNLIMTMSNLELPDECMKNMLGYFTCKQCVNFHETVDSFDEINENT
ncbi:ankyrin-1-like [Phymastichus coffea]|uniref:ankyrin-1-like n=1 Tax=Phymastichus coffea TaxID=108790 RepID=UPI00273A811F|nr:ankyrin-1-like [Phymastichus coffea]XP_058794992.1 ankyrin-1-like [Phymastichus coffea]